MKSLRSSSLRLALLAAVVGAVMVSGSSLNWTFAQEEDDMDVPEGFKLMGMTIRMTAL